ncbi:MAG: Tat pathway signal protein, partial [Pyrinomonadaceae bacterium]
RRAVREVNPEWVPPRPALDARRRPLRDNDSGEDFFFMNRRMIEGVNDVLARADEPDCPRVDGWRRVPPPGDADYPVPEFPDSGLEELKSVRYYEKFLAPWERRYTDPCYLRGVTLGQLGSDIEFTISNDMHMRWASPSPAGYRPATTTTQDIDERWDAPAYDYLGDTYSSHVNPVCWKLRGWVDDRVEDWKRAHGVTGEVEWRGTWVGPVSSHYDFHDAALSAEAEMRKIDRIIAASGASGFDGFFRPEPRRE